MPKAPRAIQLEFELPAPGPAEKRPPGLWEAVDALPAKAERAHRERRKPLKPKLRQVDILDPPPAGED